MLTFYGLLFVFIFLVRDVRCQESGVKLSLSSDAPALEKAPVGFYARLSGHVATGNSSQDLYTYVWRCPEAGIKEIIYNQSDECNYTHEIADRGSYQMRLTVELSGKTVAKASINFTIQASIIGSIKILQPGIGPHDPKYVAKNTPSNVTFDLHDPRHFLDNFEMAYEWKMNFELIATSPVFPFDFSDPSGDDEYIVTLTVTAIRRAFPVLVYFGTYGQSLEAREPIRKVNITGNTELQHGDLLELEIACEGSSPFSYCWHFAQGDVNASTQHCSNPTMTTSCDIFVVHYFQKSGNYKFVCVIKNDLEEKISVININVFDTAPEPQLSPIIVPLACCCLALVVVVIGVIYHVHTRHSHTIETADFDFQPPDNYEYRTFLERLAVTFDGCLGKLRGISGNLDDAAERRFSRSNGYRKIPAQIT